MSYTMIAKHAEEIGEENPVHWFTSSVMYWHSGDDLASVLRRQKREDLAGSLKPKGFNLFRVPGIDKKSNYKIRDYTPQVDGCEWIAYIEYREKAK